MASFKKFYAENILVLGDPIRLKITLSKIVVKEPFL